MVIGITGGIASGKSTISKILIGRHYKLIDCDQISRELTNEQEVIDVIRNTFGPEVITNGAVNRQKLGELIFGDKGKKQALEEIIHPRVIKKVQEEIKKANEELIFVDCPLLFEAKLEYLFDKIIVVYVDRENQIKRLMQRDNINYDFAIKKISSQMDLSKKKELADFVIDNNKSIGYAIMQLDEILRRLKNET